MFTHDKSRHINKTITAYQIHHHPLRHPQHSLDKQAPRLLEFLCYLRTDINRSGPRFHKQIQLSGQLFLFPILRPFHLKRSLHQNGIFLPLVQSNMSVYALHIEIGSFRNRKKLPDILYISVGIYGTQRPEKNQKCAK